MTSRAVIALGVSCAVVTLAGTAWAAERALSGKEIRQVFSGKKIAYHGATSGVQLVNADGTTISSDEKHGKNIGRWWIKDNQWCRTYLSAPKPVCMSVFLTGPKRYRTSLGYELTIK